jgi:hypothetical protein
MDELQILAYLYKITINVLKSMFTPSIRRNVFIHFELRIEAIYCPRFHVWKN